MDKYVLINAIVNAGYSQNVVEAANKAGATGATILNAKGSGSKEAKLLMGINISPEKELVLLVVKESIRDDVMKSIAESCGLSTDGQGIIYSQEVSNIIGVK